MRGTTESDAERALGRAPERLTITERQNLSGKFVALEIYTPSSLPLRRIEAVGDTPADCIRHLARRGLDPRRFEFVLLEPPFPV